MKNEKEFDYNKKKPISQQFKIKNPPEMKKEKTEDLSSLFNQPPLIKGIEVTQGKDFSLNQNKKQNNKINQEKEKEEKNLNDENKKENLEDNSVINKDEEQKNNGIISPTLPESEIINPDIPLNEENIKPNINICRNMIENMYDQKKEEVNIDIIDAVETGMNNVMSEVQNDFQENKLQIKNVKNIPVSIIDQNIKNDQIKKNKKTKELLVSKLNTINQQVNKLMENEDEINQNKKLNVKEFLENFEKDKLKAEEQARKYSEEKKIREQKMLNSVLKGNEKKEKEITTLELEEKEKKKKELEKIRMKELERIRERKRENKEKLDYIREHANDKAENENKYLFKKLENQYQKKVEQEIKLEILKKRERMREGTVTREDIIEFDKKQKEFELKKKNEMEEEKKKLKEQWKQIKDILPKFESSMMQKLREEENQMKVQKEFEENKKLAKIQEVKNYSKTVHKLFLPKINENVRKEREERIKNLNVKNNIKKIQRKKNNGRIILVKPDPNKPKKYGWKLKLEPDNKDEQGSNYRKNENPNLRSKSASKKHKPLSKLPDYLTEMRLKNDERNHNTSQGKYRGYNWNKILKNGNLIENVEIIKQKAEILEKKAKMDEKLLNTNEMDVDLQKKVSGYLIDAIKAKLSILDNIEKQ